MTLSLLHSNDHLGVHAPSWYNASAEPFQEFPSLEGAHRYDVAIVGGGYSGLSSALHLARAGYKVAIVEAHRIGWGASGRNGGQVSSGQRLDQEDLEQLVGKPLARQAFDIGVEAASLVRDLISEHQINCAYRDGIIEANHKASYNDHAMAYVDKMHTEYDYHSLSYLDEDQIRQKVGSPDFHGGLLDTQAGHLHPLNFARGLARAALKSGVDIFELSEVRRVGETAKAAIETAKGNISADWIILACNGYLGNLNGSVARRVLPINNFIIATEPLGEEMANTLIADREAVADSRFVVNYFRLSEDNRMLFGGGENYGYRFPKDIKAMVRPNMLKIFPQLSDARIDYGWGGTLAITMKRLPAFQKLPGNIVSVSGFSGSGIAMATMAGKLVGELVNGQSARFDVMQQLPTPVFPGGTLLRYPTLVAAMLWFSLRDKL